MAKPHDIKALADAGIKMYRFSEETMSKMHGNKQEAGTESMANLTTEQYDEVTSDLQKPVANASLKRKAVPKEKSVETPEMKRMKQSASMKVTSLRKCKQLIDNSTSMASKTEEDAPKILQKDYPQAMVDCMIKKVQLFQAEIAKAQSEYAKGITADVGHKQDQNEIDNLIQHIDGVSASLNKAAKLFKDGVHSDVKKLVT